MLAAVSRQRGHQKDAVAAVLAGAGQGGLQLRLDRVGGLHALRHRRRQRVHGALEEGQPQGRRRESRAAEGVAEELRWAGGFGTVTNHLSECGATSGLVPVRPSSEPRAHRQVLEMHGADGAPLGSEPLHDAGLRVDERWGDAGDQQLGRLLHLCRPAAAEGERHDPQPSQLRLSWEHRPRAREPARQREVLAVRVVLLL
mmetsp:Transcript_78188/g.253828  ORF Transcript_78188/g.253828 Transcript_78188/m.253828 type:complete len:200 (-) Transcript_78188:954-1553(-)